MHGQSGAWWRESRERLRAFIDSAPWKMWVSRVDGTIEFFNQEWRLYSGQDDVGAQGDWRDIIHPDDLPKVQAVRTAAVAAGERYDIELRLRRASDGVYRWHLSSVAPVRMDGRIVAWIGASTDIDDRLRAEDALRESEATFRMMANAMPQLAWILDPRAGRSWFNQRWLDFTGKSAEQMEADGWLALVHPDQSDEVSRYVTAVRQMGEPWEQICQLRAANGQYSWFLMRSVPIRDERTGGVARWFATGTDINEERRLQERQRLLTQEVSHRVKNGLAIVASLLALQARYAKDDDTSRILYDAYSRVQTIADVHDQLWKESDARLLDIAAFLRELCAKLNESTPGGRVIFSGASTLLPTEQAVPLGLAVNELVTNALKYAYPEGHAGVVEVALSGPKDGRLVLDVADHGAGLPPGFEIEPRSTSLGMRLIANTVRQLGATIQAADADPGARFTIMVPYSAPEGLGGPTGK